MSILSKIMGGEKVAPATAAPKEISGGAGKEAEVHPGASATAARTAKVLRSPFEEDLSKVSRTPRGLSFAERVWTRDS
jgi:hypothetical protein